MGGIDGILNKLEHGRAQGVVEVVDVFIAAVDGDGILDEVIGADGEEVRFFGQGGDRR